MKKVELKILASDAELAQTAARDWLQSSASTVAFSGGRIAKIFFAAAAALVQAKHGSLDNVDFFWADERCVPPEHPDSNFLLAQESLFTPLSITPSKIHRLKGELPPAAAAAEANAILQKIAGSPAGGLPSIDLVFLGMGEDGHIASLMPNLPDDVVNITSAYMTVENSPKPPPNRLSLTYAALAAAKNVWVLASGAGKRDALQKSLAEAPATPLGRVLQMRAHTVIYSDVAP
jgi:6-phosphogluconolactonase